MILVFFGPGVYCNIVFKLTSDWCVGFYLGENVFDGGGQKC